MLGTILNIININKETPDAVGYHLFGPIVYNPPKELLEKLNNEDRELLTDIRTSYITVDNFSTNAQKNVRILYSGELDLRPEVESQTRDITVNCNVNKDAKEITIEEILPEDSIVVSIHNPSENFELNNILIGDKMITTTMQRLASAKRRPSMLWVYLLMAISFGVAAYSFVSTKNVLDERNKIEAHMNKFYDQLGYGSCKSSIFYNPVGKEKELERAFNKLSVTGQKNTLKLNDVQSYEQLKFKDEIIFCEFIK